MLRCRRRRRLNEMPLELLNAIASAALEPLDGLLFANDELHVKRRNNRELVSIALVCKVLNVSSRQAGYSGSF